MKLEPDLDFLIFEACIMDAIVTRCTILHMYLQFKDLTNYSVYIWSLQSNDDLSNSMILNAFPELSN